MQTKKTANQQSFTRLGTVPLSSDLLAKGKFGLWAFELDEGKAPRMYVDDTMLGLLGLEHQVSPEETYHAWYDHIDEGSYGLVAEAVENMIKGPSEVQYPWHHPNGSTMIVRCGGTLNPEYTAGVRIEGVHQNVTEVIHYDEQQNRELALNNQRIMALEDNFEALYDVELESARYTAFVRGDYYQSKVVDKLLNGDDYFKDLRKDIESVVYKEDVDGLYNLLTKEAIQKELSENERIEHYYRIPIDNVPQWYKIRVVYKDKAKNNIIIGVFNAKEEMAEKLQREREELRDKAIIDGFSKEYSAVYFGNLEDSSYKILVRSESVMSEIEGTSTICDAIKEYAERSVHPSDIELFSKDLYSIDDMKAKIPVGEKYVFEYRSKENDEYCWFLADFRRLNETDILVGFKDITKEHKEAEIQRALSDGLAREYHTVWLVDGFGEHVMHLYRSTGKKTIQKAVQLGLDVPSYDIAMVKYIMDSVHEDDRERVLEATKFETLQRETPDVGTYVVSYKRYYDDKGNVDYHQMCFAKAVTSDGTVNYILAYRDADKMLREEMAMQNKLKDALSLAQEESRRTDLLYDASGSYKWTYDIDENDNVVGANYSDKILGLLKRTYEGRPMNWLSFLHKDDKERVEKSFMAAIHDHTGNTPYDSTFRLIGRTGEISWVKSVGRLIRHDDGTAELLGLSINITSQMEEQERHKKEMQENFSIIEILASEYTSVYYIDLTKDSLNPYAMNEKTETSFGSVFRSGIRYSEAFRLYVDKLVLNADRDMMLRAGSLGNIMKELRKKKTFLTTYRDADGHYSEMKFVKVGNEEGIPTAVALGFANKDDELREREEKEQRLQRNIDIIEILASEYTSVYYIDLTTDELDTYTMNKKTETEFGKIFRSGINFSKAYKMYVDTLVYEDDKKMMLKAGSLYNILNELATKKTFVTIYRNSEGHYSEMKFVKVGEEENPRAVALGFADKDEEIRTRKELQSK